MKRFFRLAFTILSMVAAMLIAAGITMRIALHAGEVTVPDFAALTAAEAAEAALHAGLDLNIEERYYSTTVPSGRILSQAPAPGSRVRKGWQVRVTESLGPQQVTIPDVSAQTVREASMNLRRAQLDLGTLAHLDAPGDPDIVIAQTPPPDAGVDQPRVSLLLSSAGYGASSAFVLPSFTGMSYSQANRAAAQLGLRTATLGQTQSTVAAAVPDASSGASVAAPAQTSGPVGPVLSQSPDSGFRANKGDTIRLTFAHVYVAAPPVAATTTPAPTGTSQATPAPSAAKSAAGPAVPNTPPSPAH